MNRFLAVLFAMSMTMSAWAGSVTIDTSGLTPAQIEEIKAKSAAMRTEATNPATISATVRGEAAAWADLGANIGTAMVGAARQIGIAANEFSQTGLGKIVTVLIVYKIAGNDLLGVVIGSLILITAWVTGLYLWFGKIFCTVTYDYRPMLFGLWQRRVVVSNTCDEDAVVTKTIAAAVMLIIGTLIGLITIF
jgi:hypothetical protein